MRDAREIRKWVAAGAVDVTDPTTGDTALHLLVAQLLDNSAEAALDTPEVCVPFLLAPISRISRMPPFPFSSFVLTNPRI